MRTVQISYDLTHPGEEYGELLRYLRAHRGTKPLSSTWLIKTTRPAIGVRDDIEALLHEGDEVLVIDVTGVEWATTFADPATDWMELEMPALPHTG